jgi:hypothetical protein
MKRRMIAFMTTCAGIAAIALVVLWPASAQTSGGLLSDHALIDQTGGDTYVQCRTTNRRAFEVHATLRAFGGTVTMRVNFQDGDFVDYQLAQDETLSLSQAAGSSAGVDRRIRISKAGGTGSLVGWMSAGRLDGSGAFVRCKTV